MCLLIQEDAYVEFMKIRKVPIEKTERESTFEDVIPMVSILNLCVEGFIIQLGPNILPKSGDEKCPTQGSCSIWSLLRIMM